MEQVLFVGGWLLQALQPFPPKIVLPQPVEAAGGVIQGLAFVIILSVGGFPFLASLC